MIKKRPTLRDEIARDMEDRSIGAPAGSKVTEEATLVTEEATLVTEEATPVTEEATPVTEEATLVTQKVTKGYKSNVISIRFDEGDYERLKEIAFEQGTNGATLIRKAVKDLIKAADKS